MSVRTLPDSPSLDHLKHEARDLQSLFASGDPASTERLRAHHRRYAEGALPASIRLSDAQLVIAREYGFPSWPKLKAHVERANVKLQIDAAIRANDLPAVQSLIQAHPQLLHEYLRSRSWGRPLTFAAQCGHLEIVRWLRTVDRGDLQHALSRASMRAHRPVMEYLVAEGADPAGPYAEGAGESYGPVILSVYEVQNAAGMRALLEMGARITWTNAESREQSPLPMLLGTYSRNPAGKHACLRVCADFGLALPDTPVMALHQGRLDLLGAHLARDAGLLSMRFTTEEIYPQDLGIAAGDGLHMAPVEGATLLHLAVEFCDLDAVAWLLERGADPNACASVDAEGFGGHTPLFHTVITLGPKTDAAARLLLDRGADPSVRATLRKQLRHMGDPELEREHSYRSVTPVELATRFHWQPAVNAAAVELLQRHVASRATGAAAA